MVYKAPYTLFPTPFLVPIPDLVLPSIVHLHL